MRRYIRFYGFVASKCLFHSAHTHCPSFFAFVSVIILPLGSSIVSLLSSSLCFLVKAVCVVCICLFLRLIVFAHSSIVVSFWTLGDFRWRTCFFFAPNSRKCHWAIWTVCFPYVFLSVAFRLMDEVDFVLLGYVFPCVPKMQFALVHIRMDFCAFVFVCYSPIASFKLHHGIVCVVWFVLCLFFVGGCSRRGMFHLAACLLAACPRYAAICPVISVLLFLHLLRSHISDIPKFDVGRCILFCSCMCIYRFLVSL